MANQGNSQSGPQLRVWWRHWSVVFILAVLAGLVIWAMLNLGPWLRAWQDQRAATAAQRLLEKAYREDTYGGKTPEETFDMFIAALEKGDVELASKYFHLKRQDQWSKALNTTQNQGLLTNFIDELKNNKKSLKLVKQEENEAVFSYVYTLEKEKEISVPAGNGDFIKTKVSAGDYDGEVVFTKYPVGNIWKLWVL